MGWGALDEEASLDPVSKGCPCEASAVLFYRLAKCLGDWGAMGHQHANLYVSHPSVHEIQRQYQSPLSTCEAPHLAQGPHLAQEQVQELTKEMYF